MWQIQDPNIDPDEWVNVPDANDAEEAAIKYLRAIKLDPLDCDPDGTFYVFAAEDGGKPRKVKIGIVREVTDGGAATVYRFEVR